MKTYIVHYRLKNHKTGRVRISALNPFDAVVSFLKSENLTFRQLAGVLSKTAAGN